MAEDCSAPLVKLEVLSQPRLLAAVRSLIGNVADRIGFSEADCSQIILAVDEALSNVINHGYNNRPDGVMWVSIWGHEAKPPEAALIRIVIEDRGEQVDPEAIRPRDLDEVRPGGLGVHIIREVMDEVRYERRSTSGMRLTMCKKAPASTSPPTEQARP